ncbi:DUF3027 domain-containing protein [Actinocrinis puniceicyclus]|uniref:DUF3027 domain-containing protein n=1 Tax=Actinocrinis puniceicyclus TaxID=977794 RepID=UPI0028A8D4A5|nr:DUF3027 domain-containing protein [Actinocrinis puniceicyclus]
MSATTKTRPSRTPALDQACADAVDLAFAGAEDVAGIGRVGEHLGVVADGERTVTHHFAARERGYVGWRWAVTVTRASRSKQVTVDETVLLPGEGAILAPRWLPWSERIQPGDIGVGDLLPTAADDPRLEPGYTGADETEPKPLRDRAPMPAGDAAPDEPQRDSLPLIAFELGLGRVRVLSLTGRESAAQRWSESFGGAAPIAQAAPASCASCGFLTPLRGTLSQAFGVCANEYSPADGHVVGLDFGCGGHSEAAVVPDAAELGEPIVDEYAVDQVQLHPSGSVQFKTTAVGQDKDAAQFAADEEAVLGHS